MDFEVEIVRAGATLVVAIVGAYVGARLALQKYRSERRWDARYSAYEEILKAASDIHTWAEEAYASSKVLPSVGSEKMAELGEEFHRARHALWKYGTIGHLTLSAGAIGEVNQFVSALERERVRYEDEGVDDDVYLDGLSEHCEKVRALANEFIENITSVAEKDL